jgi:hypothetical protein
VELQKLAYSEQLHTDVAPPSTAHAPVAIVERPHDRGPLRLVSVAIFTSKLAPSLVDLPKTKPLISPEHAQSSGPDAVFRDARHWIRTFELTCLN